MDNHSTHRKLSTKTSSRISTADRLVQQCPELKLNGMTKNKALKATLEDAICKGVYKPGDLLPSQNQMAVTYGISHNTVRESIAALVQEGLVYRAHGKGTFVCKREQKQLTLGLVISHLDSSGDIQYSQGYDVAPQLLHHIQEEAITQNASIMLYIDQDSIDNERTNLLNLLDREIDGIITLYIGEDQNLDCLEKIKSSGTPLVLIDNYPNGSEMNCVETDHFAGAYKAVNYLLNKGFSRVINLTNDGANSAVERRMEGYRAALSSRRLPENNVQVKHLICTTMTDMEEPAYEAMKKLLQDIELPFALFAVNAFALVGAWRAIQESGLDHDKFALACFDNPCTSIPEDITFIKVIQPLKEIAQTSIDIVIGILNGDKDTKHVILPPEIIVREGGETRTL